MKFYCVMFVILSMMTGCGSNKKAALEQLITKPLWVDATPREAGYYQAVGVGG